MSLNVNNGFVLIKAVVELLSLIGSILWAASVSFTLMFLWILVIVLTYFFTIKIVMEEDEG